MQSANLNHYGNAFHKSGDEENRKGGRFSTASVHTCLGEAIDLSSSGALIAKRRFKRVPGQETFGIKFKYEEIDAVVSARVVRESKKRGVGHLIAIQFVDLTDDQREAIKEIVRNSRCWRAFELDHPGTA